MKKWKKKGKMIKNYLYDGTIIPAGITCKKIPL